MMMQTDINPIHVEEQLSLIQDSFPLLVPDNDFKGYKGFFKAGSAKTSEFYIEIALPNYPAVTDLVIKNSSRRLKNILDTYTKDVAQWKESTKSFYEFISWLRNRVTLDLHEPVESNTEGIIALEELCNEIERYIGLDKLSAVSEKNIDWVELKVVDEMDREHNLRVKVHKVASGRFSCTLPTKSAKRVTDARTLFHAYRIFEEQVEKMQKFWNVMEEIDENCTILEPINPGPADTQRHISIESGVTVILNVDPYKPLAKPEIKLLGSDMKIQHLQAMLHNSEWPYEGTSLLEKLKDVLGISMAPMEVEQRESQGMSQQLSQNEMCCVCLLGDNLNQSCEACSSNFHLPCLKEWLQAVPNNRISFNRISGKCPVCQGPISCLL